MTRAKKKIVYAPRNRLMVGSEWSGKSSYHTRLRVQARVNKILFSTPGFRSDIHRVFASDRNTLKICCYSVERGTSWNAEGNCSFKVQCSLKKSDRLVVTHCNLVHCSSKCPYMQENAIQSLIDDQQEDEDTDGSDGEEDDVPADPADVGDIGIAEDIADALSTPFAIEVAEEYVEEEIFSSSGDFGIVVRSDDESRIGVSELPTSTRKRMPPTKSLLECCNSLVSSINKTTNAATFARDFFAKTSIPLNIRSVQR